MTAAVLPSVCPHDCPSACALDVERRPDGTIGRVHGADTPFTRGVICAKVARYAERVHHPARVLRPLKRIGAKGDGAFAPIGWDEALDLVADRLKQAAAALGPQTVWPYFTYGTMGLVQQGPLRRLCRVMGWSGLQQTICASAAGAGWMAGAGAKWGVDPREIAESDLVVFWGANPAATQVHLMGLVAAARKARGTRLAVVDPYRTPTAEKADLHLMPRPGTDGALACAVMHVLFRDGLADRAYLARATDAPERLEAHLRERGPDWAAAVTGVPAADIEAFARLYGATPRSFLRLGYGFSRSRNGAANLHAVACLPAVTGAWAHRGGGAVQSLSGVFSLDRHVMEALDLPDPGARQLDMSRLGPVLAGDVGDGPPVTALLVQNSNPAVVAPDSALVRRGLLRDDLFVVVHEQMMTDTARLADIVLPATTMLEHDDLYASYGHTFLQAARRVIAPLGEARTNHAMVGGLAQRLGVCHPAFTLDEWSLVDRTLRDSGLPGADDLLARRGLDCAPSFERSHFLDGFGHDDGRFRFAAPWGLPDHHDTLDAATPERPFRLITPPSRHFLNSSFSETEGSIRLAGRPTALMHDADCAALGLADGEPVRLGNARGSVVVQAQPTDGIARGVIAVEGLWAETAFAEGRGINTLTSADPAPPQGGAVFHDTAVWARKEA